MDIIHGIKAHQMRVAYHAAKVGVSVETGEVLLLSAGEACRWQVHLGFEVVVKVLIVAHWIVLFRGIHYLI